MEPGPGRIVRCAGARAAQARVLADLAAMLPPERWRARILLVVASADLREHLLAELARAHGALLGVRVVTLWTLAREILERARQAACIAPALFDVVARRAVAARSELHSLLRSFDGGDVAAVQSIHALLDAGLTADLRAATLEAARSIRDRAVAARAAALIEAALDAKLRAERLAVGTSELALGRAAELLRAHGAGLLRGEAVLVHGFADATGLGCELLAELRRTGATIYVDAPPDPREPARAVTPLVQELEHAIGGPVEVDPMPGEPAQITAAFTAAGVDAEVRELAQRLRAELDRGVAPSRLLVVARRLDGYAVALREQLRAFGIPFAGPAAPAMLAAGARRRQATLWLLQRRGAVPPETWFLAAGEQDRLLAGAGAAALRDLALALRALGLRDLRELAELAEQELRDVPLPLRTLEEDGGAARPSLPRAQLAAARAASRRLVLALRDWPDGLPLPEHALRLAELLGDELGWPDVEIERVQARFDDWPPHELQFEEFTALLAAALEECFAPALGGAGAGVRVVDALHARGLTAGGLFLIGMQRGSFPRVQAEDPLLPDSARHALAAVLPALRASTRAAGEERQIFASLLSAAPRVQLGWQHSDADGRELSRSPFLELLAIGGRLPEVVAIPARADLRLAADLAAGRPLPAPELTLHAALAGDLDDFAQGLALQLGRPPQDPLLRGRSAAIAQWDRVRGVPRLRSFFGKLRSGLLDKLESIASPAVTWLERYAGCPWRAFLARGLGLERIPDPLAALPQITPAMLGDAVHLALAELLGPQERVPLMELLATDGVSPAMPEPGQLDAAVARAVRQVAVREGLRLPGLRRVLADRARELVAAALQFDFAPGAPPRRLLGVEVDGTVRLEVDGRTWVLRFRADRVEREGNAVLLTDYKTGKPPRDLGDALRHGQRLQAAAYARAAGLAGPGVGRYVHLRPEGVTELRVPDDAEPALLDAAAATLLRALAEGWFPPRVENVAGEEPKACDWCEFKEACVRGDSGMRRRLRQLAADEGPELAAFRALWRIGVPR